MTVEGELMRACPALTAYRLAIRCSGLTEEDGQPLPAMVHTEWQGIYRLEALLIPTIISYI